MWGSGKFYTDLGILSDVFLAADSAWFTANAKDVSGSGGVKMQDGGTTKMAVEWSNGYQYGRITDEGAGEDWMVFNPGGPVDVKRSLNVNGNKVWHAGNDGSGSGLVANKVTGTNGGNRLGGQMPVYQTKTDAQNDSDVVEGTIVYVKEDNTFYYEDGT